MLRDQMSRMEVEEGGEHRWWYYTNNHVAQLPLPAV